MERRILILTSAAHFFTHLFMLIYPTIAVVQARQWGMDVADLLILTVPGFVLYGVCAMPFGLWADRKPGSLPVTLGLIGMALGALGCAASTTPWQIAASLGVVGLFASAYHPAGLGLITHGVKRTEWALGFNGAFGSAAVATAPGLAELLSESLGWRAAFLSLAIPALLFGLVFLFLPVRLEPKKRSVQTDGPEVRLFSGLFVLLCVAMTLNGLAYRGASVVLPTLFDERVHFLGHGMATSLTYGMAIVMNYAGGLLSERFAARRVYTAFHLLSLPGIVATAWLSGLPLMLLAGLYVGCALGTQPAENSLVARLTPSNRRGAAYGVKFTLAFGVGALAVPMVSHLLKTRGTSAAMLLLSTFVIALAGVVVLLNRRLRISREPAHKA